MTKPQKQKFTWALNEFIEARDKCISSVGQEPWAQNREKREIKSNRLYRVVDELIKQGWLGK